MEATRVQLRATQEPAALRGFFHNEASVLPGLSMPAVLVTGTVWCTKPYASVQDMDAYYQHLPHALLQPCSISTEFLAQYLDPAMRPADRRGRQRTDVPGYRARPPSQPAECFLAHYHYQHCLPPSRLQARGILSSLFRTPKGVRFFAAPEIASPHRAAMRFLGNALVVFQAVMILAMALRGIEGLPDVEPSVAVAKALSMRLTTSLPLRLANSPKLPLLRLLVTIHPAISGGGAKDDSPSAIGSASWFSVYPWLSSRTL